MNAKFSSQTFYQDLPPEMRPILPHFIKALPTLRSCGYGLTVYALTVDVATRHASMSGPAVTPDDVTADWPAAVAGRVRRKLAAVRPAGIGSTLIALEVRYGTKTHCALVKIPSLSRKREQCDFNVPLACFHEIFARDDE